MILVLLMGTILVGCLDKSVSNGEIWADPYPNGFVIELSNNLDMSVEISILVEQEGTELYQENITVGPKANWRSEVIQDVDGWIIVDVEANGMNNATMAECRDSLSPYILVSENELRVFDSGH